MTIDKLFHFYSAVLGYDTNKDLSFTSNHSNYIVYN